MKKCVCFGLAIVLVTMLCHNVNANDEVLNNVNIVTEDNYVPIDKDVSLLLEDVAMNKTSPENKTLYFRSARATAPYWSINNQVKSFYDANGTLMYKEGSKMVIDVSKHNGKIDWDKVKAAGIDGAILRVGYGYLGTDVQFQRNVSECNRLGIPYGVYLYSYAYDANFAYAEANGTAEMLSKVKLNLSYPIYYDIEGFSAWVDTDGSTREHPTTVAEYESIISTYINRMNELGYSGKVHVYSYRHYLQTVLNSPTILSYVSWVAAYTQTLGFENPYYKGISGWQYTSSGSVDGVPSARVDMNCFYDQLFNGSVSVNIPNQLNSKLVEQGIKFNAGYLTGFTIGGDISTIASQLASVGGVTCYNASGNIISSGGIATGQRLYISMEIDNTVQIYVMDVVIKGDVNGDGKVSALDYVKVRNHLDKKSTLVNAYGQAADSSNDSKISALDYVKIRNQLDGKSAIQQ